MAWEKLGSTKLALPDSSFSEDFSGSVTYTNNGAYTVSSTVSTAWNASIQNTGHTGAETTIDTGVTIDGGSFILDYTLKADNITNYVFFWLGLGSVSGAGYEDSQNFVGSLITLQGSSSNGDIRGGYKDSSATWSGGTNSAGNYFPAGTTRYCRLVKDGTTITSYVYPTEADRTAGTNATTSSAKTSSPATLSGLRYLQIMVSDYNPSNTNTATIDDITIYSGVSSSAAATITVDSLEAKKHLMVQAKLIASGAIDARVTFNADSGSNYATRRNFSGGTDGTSTSLAYIEDLVNGGVEDFFINMDIINIAGKEKLVITQSVGVGGTYPNRANTVGKWANTSNQISEVKITTSGNAFGDGSEVTVYGTD